MLDEYLEFDEYTCDLSVKCPMRMHLSNVTEWDKKEKKGIYAGVPRALKVISRYSLFKAELSVDATIHVLKLWCGFIDDKELNANFNDISNIEGLKYIHSWLPTYIDKILETKIEEEKEKKDKCTSDIAKENDKEKKEKLKKSLQRIMESIENFEDKRKHILEDLKSRCRDNWNRDAYQDLGNANDENSIYFEGIIAEALDEGPLKKRYLVLNHNPKEGATCWNRNDETICDRGLKLISAYLLNEIPDSSYSSIDYASYSNWVKEGCTSRKKVNAVISEFTYDMDGHAEPIFTVDYLDPDNKRNPMVKLSEKWKDSFNPRIVLEEEINKEGKDIFIYEDKGSENPLTKL